MMSALKIVVGILVCGEVHAQSTGSCKSAAASWKYKRDSNDAEKCGASKRCLADCAPLCEDFWVRGGDSSAEWREDLCNGNLCREAWRAEKLLPTWQKGSPCPNPCRCSDPPHWCGDDYMCNMCCRAEDRRNKLAARTTCFQECEDREGSMMDDPCTGDTASFTLGCDDRCAYSCDSDYAAEKDEAAAKAAEMAEAAAMAEEARKSCEAKNCNAMNCKPLDAGAALGEKKAYWTCANARVNCVNNCSPEATAEAAETECNADCVESEVETCNSYGAKFWKKWECNRQRKQNCKSDCGLQAVIKRNAPIGGLTVAPTAFAKVSGSAPLGISLSLVLTPILVVWAMVVQA